MSIGAIRRQHGEVSDRRFKSNLDFIVTLPRTADIFYLHKPSLGSPPDWGLGLLDPQAYSGGVAHAAACSSDA